MPKRIQERVTIGNLLWEAPCHGTPIQSHNHMSHLLKLEVEGAIVFRKRVILSNKLEALVLSFLLKPPFLVRI